MNPKNILLPDFKKKPKKPLRPMRPASVRPKVLTLHPQGRQKNEAMGLILVGTCAFFLSLMHFLTGAKTSHLMNFFSAWLGLGMYLLPIIIGIIGVQHFFDRPVENTKVRIAGVAGMLLCSLGLLGIEGGKLGTGLFQFLAFHVGSIPTTILLVFGTLASLIFALDILYKDFLLGVLAAVEFSVRLARLAGNLLLTLIQMGIEAVKNTFVIVQEAFGSMREAYATTTAPDLDDSQLLPYQTQEDELPAPLQRSALPEPEVMAGKMTVVPANPGEAKKRSTSEISEKTDVNSTPDTGIPFSLPSQILVQVASVPDSSFMGNAVPGAETPSQVAEAPEGNREKTPAIAIQAQEDEEEDDDDGESTLVIPPLPLANESEEPISMTVEVEDPNAPVSLDSHPIDKDLKDLAPSVDTEDLEPPRKNVQLPPLDLLIVPTGREKALDSRLNERKDRILKTLAEFGIQAEITDVVEGPVVSRFELKPGPAVKAAKITGLETNLAMNLEATSIRIEAPIYGKNAIGIEIPNLHPQPVFFHDLVKNDCFKSSETFLNLALGVTIDARPVFADLSDMPHLLIAGSTGSGKSVCVNTIIASILYQATAEQVKMVMIDPKMVELSSYNGIPHLISPVVTDPKKASAALLWAVEEMTRRYTIMASCEVKKISVYNQELERLRREVDPHLEPMPFLVIIIDELADLMMTASAEVEGSICRLAQMARAVGMHLVIATQRPSVDVLTGIIKANLPSRIAFAVTSQIDSRTILDTKGAESLLGKGDMLFVPKGKKPIRVQGAYISDRELQNIISWVKQQGAPDYIDIAPTQADDDDEEAPMAEDENGDEDSRLLTTIQDYLQTQDKTSTSMLQRKFKIGYNRAARIMDLLEEKGLVSPADGSNKRRVLGKRSASQA